jgi:60 kDa SS-A/Ro ribonucleoprotein
MKTGNYLSKGYGTKVTPQSEKIPGSNQVPNSAGGFAFGIDDWKRLDRFLLIGSEGGSYYTSERELTKGNAEAVARCIEADGIRVVNRIVEISEAGRAPKNDPALFALAMCAGIGDEKTRKSALEVLPKVARIGTHLFHFVSYVEQFRGWGRGLRNAIGEWYNEKSDEDLAFQVVKYQQRDGWSNRDLLRLSHPVPLNDEHKKIFKWVVDGECPKGVYKLIQGFEKAKVAKTEKALLTLIEKYGLTMEMIPTQFANSPAVFEALLPNLGLTAVIRNLGNMSKSGYLAKGKWDAVNAVCERILDEKNIKKSRVHPITILNALVTYKAGHGLLGKGEWEVVPEVTDALDKAFYLGFPNVEPTDKRIVLALDVSGSMCTNKTSGFQNLTARLASAAMAMVTYKTEKSVAMVAFCDKIVPLDISRCTTLEGVVGKMSNLEFGRTDCAQPMIWATEKRVEADAFIVYTDNETWFGKIHPTQALKQYRKNFGIPAKLIVAGMTATEFSIADPADSGMLDVVGFDSSAPQIMSQFITE